MGRPRGSFSPFLTTRSQGILPSLPVDAQDKFSVRATLKKSSSLAERLGETALTAKMGEDERRFPSRKTPSVAVFLSVWGGEGNPFYLF